VISQEAFFYDAPQTNKKDEIVTFNQIKVIASRMAVTLNNEPQGWVISFRSKDDINTLSLQLSQVQQYADNLRAVQHEHRNLISTIAGLLFLNATITRWILFSSSLKATRKCSILLPAILK
jgi:two-component system cit operon sensor histidine kinase CitA